MKRSCKELESKVGALLEQQLVAISERFSFWLKSLPNHNPDHYPRKKRRSDVQGRGLEPFV